ncbi:hypothetical protein WJX74_005458 [Apatococcus lobatus]|uniref:Myb-like domain-containing protein n=1 Tax=Apatococcus lobatus TaxID=904363 RepID=A0AAW1RSZ9_9CHLO
MRFPLATQPKQLHTDLEVPPESLQPLARRQEQGLEYYGDHVLPTSKRRKTCSQDTPLLQACLLHEPQRQVPFWRPQHLKPRSKLTAEDEAVLKAAGWGSSGPGSWDPAFLVSEEDKLIVEARKMGMQWHEIAQHLPERTIGSLRKQFGNSRPKPKSDKPRRPSAPLVDLASGRNHPDAINAPGALKNAAANNSSSSQGNSTLNPFRAREPSPAAVDGRSASRPSSAAAGSAAAPGSARATPSPAPPHDDVGDIVELNSRRLSRNEESKGQGHVQLSKPLPSAPENFTGAAAHDLDNIDGFKFYQQVAVADPDDAARKYEFDLADPTHCACFNVRDGKDGSPIISWSNLCSLYEMPDGSQWAEHGNLVDAEDLEELASKAGKDHKQLLGSAGASDQELFKKQGRCHSRLENIEYECWVFPREFPEQQQLIKMLPQAYTNDLYYWRTMFNPVTFQTVVRA